VTAAPRVWQATERRAAASDGAARRVVVGVLKRVLPAAAVLLLAAVALWPQLRGLDDQRRYTFRRDAGAPPDTLRIQDARFQGVDELGRPYTVTARSATQVSNSDAIALDEPKADMTLQDGAWVLLQAAEGTFRRQGQTLDLAGGVVLNHDAGYEVRTESASIDLAARGATGDRPVAAQGAFGTLDGQGFVATDGGRVITVTGPARLVLQDLP
jgi:lipopolysaccharide export system protein LptC